MKRLLVADIDGTLAYDDHVPDDVSETCRALVAMGWDIVLATGRIL
ncbi:MAG TPA: haloacid dehalogenase, partial [Synergistetes bacterium]|nr:haloacid dehalogenase [Synergistota bacterium]